MVKLSLDQKINETSQEEPTKLFKVIGSKIILLLLLLILLPLIFFSLNLYKKAPAQQWINCNDARDVIEEVNTLYVACSGGVLVVDKNSGNIVDQISMTNGLGNSITTSLVKKRNTLFIGTQDGFTIFDLNSRQAKKISVGQGLVNGSNIELREDGDNLWIGTFDGVSLYKINTGEIVNFRGELADNSTGYGVREILVTPKAVYAAVSASSLSPGGIARFDKEKQTWERFGPEIFSKGGPYSRVDFFNLVKVKDKIFVTDLGNETDMLWQADDKLKTTWKPLEKVTAQLKKSYKSSGIFRVDKVTGGNELNIIVSGNLFKYNPETEQLTPTYSSQTKEDSLLTDISLLSVVRNGKIWTNPYPYLYYSKDNKWLRWLDIDSLRNGWINLSRKPERFVGITTLINSEPIIIGDGTFWKYDKSRFIKLIQSDLNLGGLDQQAVFQPVIDSNLVFIYSQSCGEGCREPKVILLNYNDLSSNSLKLSPDIEKKIKFNWGFSLLSFQKVYSERKEAVFAIGDLYSATESAVLSLDSREWKIEPTHPSNISDSRIMCNTVYYFKNVFSEFPCSKQLEINKYRYTLVQNDLFEEDKYTGKKTKLELPATPPEYSPFPDWPKTQNIQKVRIINDELWIGTDKGLVKYNAQAFRKWKLFSVEDGLVSNNIIDFVIDKTILWVLTEGGLSAIPL